MAEENRVAIERWIAKEFFQDDIHQQAKVVINEFLQPRISRETIPEEFYERFKNTRMELLGICCKEENPRRRWSKVKKFLAKNLTNLIYFPPYYVHSQTFSSAINILGDQTDVHDCINFVAICNASNKRPKDARIWPSGSSFFRIWPFWYDRTRMKVKLKNQEIKITDVPRQDFEKEYVVYVATFECNDTLHDITHNKLFESLKQYMKREGLGEKYPLDLGKDPSSWLFYLDEPHQQKFLTEITGIKGKWKTKPKKERLRTLDKKKVAKSVGVDLQEIANIDCESRLLWVPNNFLCNTKALGYDLLTYYLKKIPLPEREKLLFRLATRIDYAIFEIPSFREIILKWKENEQHKKLLELSAIFNFIYSPPQIKRLGAGKKHWYVYLDMEALISVGYTRKRASEELTQKYNNKSSSLLTRYKTMASKAKKLKLTPEEIIAKYDLDSEGIPIWFIDELSNGSTVIETQNGQM